jgi:hypothetical protein
MKETEPFKLSSISRWYRIDDRGLIWTRNTTFHPWTPSVMVSVNNARLSDLALAAKFIRHYDEHFAPRKQLHPSEVF